MKRTFAVLVCVLALAACNKAPKDDGIASAGNPGANPSATPIATDNQERMRQFAQCMRENGIDMPDPEVVEGEGGKITVRVEAGEAKPGDAKPGEAQGAAPLENREKFQAAMKACQQFQPQGGPMGGKPDPEMEEKMRQFAKCMRENGVENFPDPQSGGGIMIGGPGTDGNSIDPSDPAFQAAEKKCESLLPKRMEAKKS